jgi:HNH endonuclease
MFAAGEVISYLEMCREEGLSLQRGMNFRVRGGHSVVLMSTRSNAPYPDRIENEGQILIYEGHDAPAERNAEPPKSLDQPWTSKSGRPTQNKLFFDAAKRTVAGDHLPEPVRVYEKIRGGIWVYNGLFQLLDAWIETRDGRKLFKFRLEISPEQGITRYADARVDLPHDRLIPSAVKLDVWKRDHGRCVKCGSINNLHFDHILPYSKGGSSLVAQNVQILCARHNLEKRDHLE